MIFSPVRKNALSAPYLERESISTYLIDIIEIPQHRQPLCPAVLQQKYVIEKASMKQIAREFLCSKNAVRNALIAAKIPLRKRAERGYAASIAYGTVGGGLKLLQFS